MTDTTITYDWQVSRLDCLPMAPEGADYVVTGAWAKKAITEASTESSIGLPL